MQIVLIDMATHYINQCGFKAFVRDNNIVVFVPVTGYKTDKIKVQYIIKNIHDWTVFYDKFLGGDQTC